LALDLGSSLGGGIVECGTRRPVWLPYVEVDLIDDATERAHRPGAAVPQFAPQTGVGGPAVEAYATQAGLPLEDFLHQLPYPLLTPEIAATAMLELVQTDAAIAPAYLLNGAGLQKLP
jgi:hypothetical protein